MSFPTWGASGGPAAALGRVPSLRLRSRTASRECFWFCPLAWVWEQQWLFWSSSPRAAGVQLNKRCRYIAQLWFSNQIVRYYSLQESAHSAFLMVNVITDTSDCKPSTHLMNVNTLAATWPSMVGFCALMQHTVVTRACCSFKFPSTFGTWFDLCESLSFLQKPCCTVLSEDLSRRLKPNTANTHNDNEKEKA